MTPFGWVFVAVLAITPPDIPTEAPPTFEIPGMVIMTEEQRQKIIEIMLDQDKKIEALERKLYMLKLTRGCS